VYGDGLAQPDRLGGRYMMMSLEKNSQLFKGTAASHRIAVVAAALDVHHHGRLIGNTAQFHETISSAGPCQHNIRLVAYRKSHRCVEKDVCSRI
jgi:hypothetical protein